MYILYYFSIFGQSALAVEELWLVHQVGKMLGLHIASLFTSVFSNIQSVKFSQYFVTRDSYNKENKVLHVCVYIYISISIYIIYIFIYNYYI